MNLDFRSKTTWVITGLSAAVLVLIVAVATMAGALVRDDTPPRTGEPTPAEPSPEKSWPKVDPELPAEAVSGSAKVKVNSTSRAESLSDEAGGSYTPAGEYIVADLTITNVGKEPWVSADTDIEFELIGPDGATYASDMEAMAISSYEAFVDLNPGNTARTRIPFDVPAGTEVVGMSIYDISEPMAAPAEVKVP